MILGEEGWTLLQGLFAVLVVTVPILVSHMLTARKTTRTVQQATGKLDEVATANQTQHGQVASSLGELTRFVRDSHYGNRLEHLRMMDALAVPMMRANSQGEVTWANRAMLRALGLTRVEVLGHGWLAGVDSRDRDAVRALWTAYVTQHTDFGPESFRLHRGRCHELSASAFIHPDGSLEWGVEAQPHPEV